MVAQEQPEIRFSGVAGNSGSDTLLQGTTLSLQSTNALANYSGGLGAESSRITLIGCRLNMVAEIGNEEGYAHILAPQAQTVFVNASDFTFQIEG